MTLQEQIDADMKDAMRGKQQDKLGVLRMLKSDISYATIQNHGGKGQLTDQEVVQVIRKQIKQREDAMASFSEAGREQQAAKEQMEMGILSSYLPKQLAQEEITALVREAVHEVKTGDVKPAMGAVMKIATSKAAGRADGRALSQEVQKQLSAL